MTKTTRLKYGYVWTARRQALVAHYHLRHPGPSVLYTAHERHLYTEWVRSFMRPPRATKQQMIADYRRRRRLWLLEALPSMPDKEWKNYAQWVADFGGMRTRKLKRQLNAVYEDRKVTCHIPLSHL